MHKIPWQRKRNELQNIWMFISRGCCPRQILPHAEEIADSVTACAVKNKLSSGVHTDQNVLDLNCHVYVVEATLKNKCMCFQDYDYIVQRAPNRCINRRLLTDLENELNRSKQQEERIRRPDTVWLLTWREVNRILKDYIFIYGSVPFSFFRHRLKSTEWP